MSKSEIQKKEMGFSGEGEWQVTGGYSRGTGGGRKKEWVVKGDLKEGENWVVKEGAVPRDRRSVIRD